jgi:hypothetical protein
VIIALPIESQPDIIRLAVKAEKHILSEKPMGATVSTGQALLDLYEMTPEPRKVSLGSEGKPEGLCKLSFRFGEWQRIGKSSPLTLRPAKR